MNNNPKNLHKLVRKALKDTLILLVPKWLDEPESDWRRIVKPNGGGSFSVSIESYRGASTWISFRKKFHESETLRELTKDINEHQPVLLGWINYSSSCMRIEDIFSLVIGLCIAAAKKNETRNSIEISIDEVLDDLDRIISCGFVEKEVVTVLRGLRLPIGVERVELGENITLRNLSNDEISDLGSNDILSNSNHDFTSGFATTAIFQKKPLKFYLSLSPNEIWIDFSEEKEIQNRIDNIVRALHIACSGQVGVVASHTTLNPAILPGMRGSKSSPLVFNPFSSMEISHEQIDFFVSCFCKLQANAREEVKIAATRLVDAEIRLSVADSLLDSVIGLEVLLNPVDYTELAFRVALNYAYLGGSVERRKRYESIREIQKTRNSIVHGGLTDKSAKSEETIRQHAALAKECLRDAIRHFMNDKEFSSDKKIDADFWLDRVIPPDPK